MAAFQVLSRLTNFPDSTLVWAGIIVFPAYAAMARRLRDTGRSAWNILLIFIPLVGVL
ncbi:DUF805 domain-containing protein [Streptomyces sp. NPDC091272]|uniref:DUF805 domain-containing protein n=1 Tax=Streptomyces sp. NPDC091272 TaxID=3365981 RepID=UPI00382DB161